MVAMRCGPVCCKEKGCSLESGDAPGVEAGPVDEEEKGAAEVLEEG